MVKVFKDFALVVKTFVGLLEDSLDKWAIFDNWEHPAPTFAEGRVCLAGYSTHASWPHHGAGAGFGVEDALAISIVIE